MHIALLIIVICIIYIIVIMGGIALQLTGLEKSRAKFQALSAFSGTGFTTREAESVVNHPRRRRIIMTLMILGNAGIVSLIATFASSLRKTEALDIPMNLAIIAASIFLLYKIASQRSFATRLTRRLSRLVRRILHLHDMLVEEVLDQGDGYGVARILMGAESRHHRERFAALRVEQPRNHGALHRKRSWKHSFPSCFHHHKSGRQAGLLRKIDKSDGIFPFERKNGRNRRASGTGER